MRGGIQYQDVFDTTYAERQEMLDYINERLEYESKKVKDWKGKISPIY